VGFSKEDDEQKALFEQVVKDSIDVANTILTLNNTAPRLFVCLGASPAYVYSALSTIIRKRELSHNIVEIPLSGMSLIYSDSYTIPSEEKKTHFLKYISQFIVNKDKSMIIIDHCHTCKSVDSFIRLLRETNFYTNDIDYINLLDDVTADGWIQRPTLIRNYEVVRSSTLNKISGHVVPRAVPEYSFWHDLGTNSVNYDSISEDARALQKSIVERINSLT